MKTKYLWRVHLRCEKTPCVRVDENGVAVLNSEHECIKAHGSLEPRLYPARTPVILYRHRIEFHPETNYQVIPDYTQDPDGWDEYCRTS